MPPRVRYTADKILDAALRLTQTEGIDTVTARSVAASLGCSTAPIFTHFASMEALHERLLARVMERFVARALGAQGEGAGEGAGERDAPREDDDPLVAAGVGWLRFAAEEPRLYEAIFLRRHPWHGSWGVARRALADRMRAHPRYAALPREACFALVGRASIVMHGLGLELWSGRLPQSDLTRLVHELALPAVNAAMAHEWTLDLHSATAPQAAHTTTEGPETAKEPTP